MARPESLWNEHLDGLLDEFIAAVAKKGLDPFVYKGDPPFFVNHDHRGSRRFDHQPEALFGKPAFRDVEQNTVHQNRLTVTVELGTAAPDKPANLTIRQHHPVFELDFPRPSAKNSLTASRNLSRSSGWITLLMRSVSSFSDGEKPKDSSRFVGEPNFIVRNVPSPQGEADRTGRDLHVLLCFAQCRLTCFQFPRELRRSSHIVTQLIAHRRHDSRICEAEEKRDAR